MAAKQRSTTPKKLDLHDGVVTHLRPDLLDFDPENPRLAESVATEGRTESDLLRFLWKEMNVKEVALSIIAKGYFEHEPMFAVCTATDFLDSRVSVFTRPV